MFRPDFWSLLVILVIVLLIFGPKNLPKIGHALGKGIREFKDATKEVSKGLEDEDNQDQKKES